jgi:hypothetical protein
VLFQADDFAINVRSGSCSKSIRTAKSNTHSPFNMTSGPVQNSSGQLMENAGHASVQGWPEPYT